MSRKQRGFSRRQFFKTAGAAGLAGAAGVAGAYPPSAGAAQAMPTRPFGKTGYQVSILSLGGMFDIPANQVVLRAALSLGVTYWDTARSYTGGKSEEGMGIFFAANPGVREKVFLVSKSTSRDPEDMTAELGSSLKRLQTTHLDLFFVHSIRSIEEMTPEIMAWGKAMKKAGKIKLFGFSTHSNMAQCLAGAPALGGVDGIMMTYNYRNMYDEDMKAAVKACHQAGIGLTAMKTMGSGPLATMGLTDESMAERWVKKGFTPEQAKLKVVWEDPRIAAICSQMPNLLLLRTNAAAALNRTRLSRDDHLFMAGLAGACTGEYCAGCADICENALEESIPLRELMRALMYDQAYGESGLARECAEALSPDTLRALARTDLTPAERSCPQNLPIGNLMGQVLRRFA